MTREEWLHELTERLRPAFDAIGQPLPDKVRSSCGFPSHGALSTRRRVVGQCWYPEASTDGTTEVFVSPVQSDGLTVAETLAHELCHAACGKGHGHKGLFVEVARKIGFTAPWKSTPATPELKERLNALLPGPYPHAELHPLPTEKKQSTRLVKIVCRGCGYTLRTTRKWLERAGLPICPCSAKAMNEDEPGGNIGA